MEQGQIGGMSLQTQEKINVVLRGKYLIKQAITEPEGNYGKLFHGNEKEMQDAVIIEKISPEKVAEHQQAIEREIMFSNHWNNSDCEFTIQILDVFTDIDQNIIIVRDPNFIISIFQTINGRNSKKFDEVQLKHLLVQIISGISNFSKKSFCQKVFTLKNIFFKDLKPQVSFYENRQPLYKNFCVDSPEMLENEELDDEQLFASQVFSFGIIAYYLASHTMPFNNKQSSFINQIEDGPIFADKHFKGYSQDLEDLISSMLKSHYSERIKFPDILKHKFFQERGNKDELKPMDEILMNSEDYRLVLEKNANLYSKAFGDKKKKNINLDEPKSIILEEQDDLNIICSNEGEEKTVLFRKSKQVEENKQLQLPDPSDEPTQKIIKKQNPVIIQSEIFEDEKEDVVNMLKQSQEVANKLQLTESGITRSENEIKFDIFKQKLIPMYNQIYLQMVILTDLAKIYELIQFKESTYYTMGYFYIYCQTAEFELIELKKYLEDQLSQPYMAKHLEKQFIQNHSEYVKTISEVMVNQKFANLEMGQQCHQMGLEQLNEDNDDDNDDDDEENEGDDENASEEGNYNNNNNNAVENQLPIKPILRRLAEELKSQEEEFRGDEETNNEVLSKQFIDKFEANFDDDDRNLRSLVVLQQIKDVFIEKSEFKEVINYEQNLQNILKTENKEEQINNLKLILNK